MAVPCVVIGIEAVVLIALSNALSFCSLIDPEWSGDSIAEFPTHRASGVLHAQFLCFEEGSDFEGGLDAWIRLSDPNVTWRAPHLC